MPFAMAERAAPSMKVLVGAVPYHGMTNGFHFDGQFPQRPL
jgi:hypothetical protein